MKLRVGVVGLGNAWESRHRTALRALSDRFEVRAVCEQVSTLAEHVAREFDAQAVDGFRALARREDVDAVLLLARQWYGALPILAACDEGKAVYCAAHLDLDLDQARLLKDRVEKSGIAFMAEYPRRHASATIRLKELIATRIGEPRLLFCHLRVPAEDSTKKLQRPQDAGKNELVELIDWCRYVVGVEPTSVLGMLHASTGNKADSDYQMMSLDFSEDGKPGTGAVAQISCGRYMPAAWPEAASFRPPAALQVACERGIAFIDLPSTLIWFDSAGRHMESLDSERPVGELMLSQFYRSVSSLVRNTTSLDDTFRALSVVNASRRSHAEERRVKLEW
ncbi:MAG: Gfo/Idh/MocA family protein [Pirellulales bacterium]